MDKSSEYTPLFHAADEADAVEAAKPVVRVLKNISKEAREDAFRMRREGASIKEIADKHGRTPHSIASLLSTNKVYPPESMRQRYLTEQEQAEIIKRYLAGEELLALAEEYGCSKGRIFNLLKEWDVKIRHKPKGKKRPPKPPRKCIVCGASPLPKGCRYCEECRLYKRREHDKTKWQEKTGSGICTRCRKPLDRDGKTCKACRILHKQELQERKVQCITAYGGCCECCLERLTDLLTVDHRNDDGGKLRRLGEPTGDGLYRWLIKNNFPSDYRILCIACNWGRRFSKVCPHTIHEMAVCKAIAVMPMTY
jgi:transposase-like protein